MASSRTVLIAGAGIGGLTAALALAARGFRTVVFEQSPRLQETGAGIQLSPNATRVLLGLGLGDRLRPHVVVPEAISINAALNARMIARIPLGGEAEFRYGSPYWMIHRADLHTALAEAAEDNPDIVIRLGMRVEDFAVHENGLTAQLRSHTDRSEERGIALIGADGIWSVLRGRLGRVAPPRYRNRTAWRATLPADAVAIGFRSAVIHLWLGPNAHLVHYPVRGGQLINVVAIINDTWRGQDWSAPGLRKEILSHFPLGTWSAPARTLLATPESWLKWALYDRTYGQWGDGPVTLLGDAAHPTLPFLAQGAAMAIEDAATLAECVAAQEDNLSAAMRRYEGLRRGRTARVQQAAFRAGQIYHFDGPLAFARDLGMRAMGGEKLRANYDWLYDWRI